MNTPLILHSATAGEGVPLPLGLSGYPTQIEGKVCHYRRKELARVGKYVHRGTREPFELSAQRLDAIAATFNARIAKGIRPFVADRHTLEPSAEQGKGFVVALHRQGDAMYADLQLIGDDALALCATNDVSLCTLADQIDADGVKYPEVLHHVALTPNPALSNLGPFVKIAASAGGGSAIDAPVYAAEQENPPMLNPETLKKLRQKLNLGDDVKDADVAEKAAALALTDPPADRTAEVTALSADKTRLEGELAAANQRITALSAGAPEPDALSLSLISESFKSKREAAIASGNISEAGAKLLDELMLPGGKPGSIALSLSGDGVGVRPLYSRVMEIIAANPGVKPNNPVERAQPSLQLSADPNDPLKHMTHEERLAYAAQCMGVAAPAAK